MPNALKFAPSNTGALVLADGSVFLGQGFGAIGENIGEVCFNTAITGYQEILTDPSYRDQIIAFTMPHIGNVGANAEDEEAVCDMAQKAAIGLITKGSPTLPSNWRAEETLPDWLSKRGIIGLSGIDTRALTHIIREKGMQHGVIAHNPNGKFDFDAMAKSAKEWAGLEGADLAKDVSSDKGYEFDKPVWDWHNQNNQSVDPKFHVVVMDFGVKGNILRDLVQIGARVSVVPASACFDEIMALSPDGILLSNGPGDPAATGEYSVKTIKALVDAKLPVFGICLGHQMLGLALGAKTVKMKQGHHGANHPVQDLRTSKVEIVSMNHGFAIDRKTLGENIIETHVSLFDGSNCGIALKGAPVFSVQYHPEASPGPQDSFYLFEEFASLIEKNIKARA